MQVCELLATAWNKLVCIPEKFVGMNFYFNPMDW